MQIDNNIPIPEIKSQRGKSAKAKGAGGEREALANIVVIMQEVERELNLYDEKSQSLKVQRNLQQAIAGGHDIVGIPMLCVEVKRQETLHLDQWWQQTTNQAAKTNDMPVLLYRQSRQQWKVRTYVKLECPPYDIIQWIVADINLDKFLAFYRQLYSNWLLTGKLA